MLNQHNVSSLSFNIYHLNPVVMLFPCHWVSPESIFILGTKIPELAFTSVPKVNDCTLYIAAHPESVIH